MKRLIFALSLSLFLFFGKSAEAAKYIESQATFTTAGTAIVDLSLTSGNAVYTSGLRVSDNVGFSAILITEDKAGGAGDVDVSAEYSIDGVNFYVPYTTDSGTLTADSNIVTALQNATRFIQFTSRPANFMRIKLDPDADSEVTLYYIYQKESQ